MSRLSTWVALVLLFAAVEAHARTRAVRATPPPLDQETLNAVVLELGSIDIEPGAQRTLRLYRWMCCVYPVPVTADVRFFVDSWNHATLDPGSGLLTIAADAPGGTTFRVYADIEHGRRLISADVYVDTRKTNPLLGWWTQTGEIPCDGTPERVALTPIRELVFRGDRTFSVTWFPFEVYKDYWGFYAFDKPPGRLTLGIRHGNYVPATFRGDGTFTITEEGGGKRRLTVREMSFGRPHNESGAQTDCGAVFVQ